MAFTVSAPGKIILFGEHAVVHGVPAIAASIALHTFVGVEQIPPGTSPNCVELEFSDVQLSVGWTTAELETDLPLGNPADPIPTELDPKTLAWANRIVESTTDSSKPFSRPAALAFLYLYLSIRARVNKVQPPPLKFSTLSTLPIGAGLGSSAALSVCLAAAILRASGQLKENSPHELAMQLVAGWSYLGECCIHGKPSGIDNIVATHGGAVYFQRNSKEDEEGNIVTLPPTIRPYSGFPELDLILTDTTVPRLTSELVARVECIKTQWPKIFNALLSAFLEIVTEADALLSNKAVGPDFAVKLSELADLNHGLLVTVSVSHPALEQVRQVSRKLGLGTTKLTGAGGGGCAITIVAAPPESDEASSIVSRTDQFRQALGPEFRVFATKLGSRGVGYADGVSPNLVGLDELYWKFW